MVHRRPALQNISNFTYLEIAIALAFIWIGINLWYLFARNFFFHTLGFDHNSTIDTLVIAVIFTVLFWLYLYLVPADVREDIEDII